MDTINNNVFKTYYHIVDNIVYMNFNINSNIKCLIFN